MKLYPRLTEDEELMLFDRLLEPEKTTNYVTVYTEEGIFEVEHTIKQVVLHDAECYEAEAEGRTFQVDPTVVHKKDVWQLPVPNVRDETSVSWFRANPSGGWIVRERSSSGSMHYFVGETVESAALWLNAFFQKK